MAEFRNPAVLSEATAPTNGQVAVYNSSEDVWVATTIAAASLVVPQAPPSEPTQTGVDVVTTAPTTSTPYGYTTSAQAAAIVTELNATVADVAALVMAFDALVTLLVDAGILS